MRIRLIGRLAVATAATVGVVSRGRFVPGSGAACRSGSGAAAAGRGRQAGPPEPTPRLADGTVNLGRVPGEKGIWSVPYITNMGARLIGPDGQSLAPQPAGRRGGGGGGGGRRARRGTWRGPGCAGAASAIGWRRGRRRRRSRRRQVRAVGAVPAVGGGRLRLQLEKPVEVRSGRVLPASGRSADDGDAVSGGDHPAAGAEAHHHDLRGRHAHLARDLHGWPRSIPRETP